MAAVGGSAAGATRACGAGIKRTETSCVDEGREGVAEDSH